MSFADLGLPDSLVAALAAVGYEAPSPIQAQAIPLLLEGRDLLGLAQTGTGKTAAFALPVLAGLKPEQPVVQALVLTPTRELAIQVAEAFQRYAAHLGAFRVLPIYGGQAYGPQLQGLRRGAQVVVGTPGRIKDHLERGTLKLDGLRTVVLDEADEMLRMGFAEEVDLILQRTPSERQVALFSATMPPPVRRIAQTHLRNPAEVTIAAKTRTATDVRQRYCHTHASGKLEALTRILETEPFDAMIIFARTKAQTTELAEKLLARGFSASALNGDMAQAERERTVERLKGGQVDIVVATDVAARGLDVERISHVLNFDIPTDTESYIHRIGRTGRAGRSGEAILFVTPREKNLLRLIERATRQPIAEMRLPSLTSVNERRIEKFRQQIIAALADEATATLRPVLEQMVETQGIPAIDLACALARMLQGDRPLLASETPAPEPEVISAPPPRPPGARGTPPAKSPRPAASSPRGDAVPAGSVRYRLEVGHQHQVKPGQIVGAIANEADLDSQYIGRVQILEDHSLVDLPEGMPRAVQKRLAKAWVCGRQLQLTPVNGAASAPPSRPPVKRKPRPGPPRR